MKTFEIPLKNEKENYYRVIILLFVVLHAVFFIYLLFDETLWKRGVAGLVAIVLYSGYRWLITNTGHQKFSFGSGIFFVFAIAFTNIVWLSTVNLLLSVLSQIALQQTIFRFTSSRIEKSPYPFKKYQWNELSNVILKDNMLTIDFKNNKLLQAEIATNNFNEQAFNTFATEQLNISS